MKQSFWKIWLVPLLLGFSSLTGLISALAGDNFWDLLSWLTLGIVPVVIVWALYKAGRAPFRPTDKSGS